MRVAAGRNAAALDELPLWPPLLAARGPGSTSAGHAHHAMHLVLACDGVVRVTVDGRTLEAAGVLTAPDAPHAIDAEGVEVLLVFLDPESRVGSAIAASLDGPARLLTREQRDALLCDAGALMGPDGERWSRDLAARLGLSIERPRAMHPAVRRALAQLRSTPEGASLEGLAAAVGLSPSRFMHAFTESVGIPLRPYLAWLKLQRAAAGIVAGHPLAAVAHAAGFADAAHMTRTFRRFLGMPPSALRR